MDNVNETNNNKKRNNITKIVTKMKIEKYGQMNKN